MSFVSIGDLSRGFALRTQTAEIKARLDRLGEEVTTGITDDPRGRLRGDFRVIGAIEHSLTIMEGFDLATSEAALTTDAVQNALSQVGLAGETLSPSLLDASTMHDHRTIDALGTDARAWLDMTVSVLNSQVAGRSLFAGAATNLAALAPGEDIFAEVQTAIAGLTSAEDVLTALDTWFDTPGGGFDTLAYTGSTSPAGSVRLNETRTMTLDVTAASPEIRDMLKYLMTGALLSDPSVLAGDLDERAALAGAAGERLMTGAGALTSLRAEVGTAQAQIESIATQNTAKRNMLELARVELLEVDAYEAASEFTAVEAQLETMYTVTARLSRLSLADYL